MAKAKKKGNAIDARRKKPRIGIVLTPEGREMATALAKARGLSISSLLETLIRAQAERDAP